MFLDKYSGAEVLLCYGDSIESVKWLKSCRGEILKLLAQYKDISLFTVGELTKMKNPRHPCRLHFYDSVGAYAVIAKPMFSITFERYL